MKINNRHIEPGTELSIAGERGRFAFRWMTGECLTCWGGRIGHEKFRTFTQDRVTKVHNKPKMKGWKQ